jgi:DNA processing protein
MAAWGTHVVIVEAGKKSGALATADFAKQYERTLYAVPHQIDADEGIGTNRLIAQGAVPYLGFSSLQWIRKEKRVQEKQGSRVHSSMLRLLQQGPLTVEQLAEKLHAEESELTETLFSLELEGEIYMRGDMITLGQG